MLGKEDILTDPRLACARGLLGVAVLLYMGPISLCRSEGYSLLASSSFGGVTRSHARVACERRRKSARWPVLSRLASLATNGELTRTLISCALG